MHIILIRWRVVRQFTHEISYCCYSDALSIPVLSVTPLFVPASSLIHPCISANQETEKDYPLNKHITVWLCSTSWFKNCIIPLSISIH